jgi:hypothetical protein
LVEGERERYTERDVYTVSGASVVMLEMGGTIIERKRGRGRAGGKYIDACNPKAKSETSIKSTDK